MTVALNALTPYTSFQCSSGNTYESAADLSVAVAPQDVAEMLAQGCTFTLATGVTVSDDITTLTLLGMSTELDLVGGTDGVYLFTGDSTTGGSGSIEVSTGLAAESAPTGTIYISSGPGTDACSSGSVLVNTGQAQDGQTGVLFLTTGPASGDGQTGGISMHTGNTANNTSGDVFVTSGNATGGNSGAIQLVTGTATGTRGSITLDALHVVIANLPTSASGLATGTLWNSSGTLKVA